MRTIWRPSGTKADREPEDYANPMNPKKVETGIELSNVSSTLKGVTPSRVRSAAVEAHLSNEDSDKHRPINRQLTDRRNLSNSPAIKSKHNTSMNSRDPFYTKASHVRTQCQTGKQASGDPEVIAHGIYGVEFALRSRAEPFKRMVTQSNQAQLDIKTGGCRQFTSG
ncbi:hypothetical protein CLF_111489 [Clonorchis sinensis]|uniref:Uncharacterized protein n=1 Tax=Clonorchis sinensis TaxID=79923 RepID=G7YUZ4_CLOSI|nr:hypothetical protein CLF_111489 [Clonorchis sinensis]